MSAIRNIKNVPYYQIGFGAWEGLGDLLDARRAFGGPALFIVDHYFQGQPLPGGLPAKSGDKVIFADSSSEPTVEYADSLADGAKAMLGGLLPCCVVGIGGGAVLDLAKAVANLLTNPGKAEDYQGWDLVKNAPPHTIGVPTISGTGSECSRTCVLTNEKRKLKLGMNSDFTVFDQLLLDPALTRSVPRPLYFFTGLDTYMHCMEALKGRTRNVMVDRLSGLVMNICRDVFLGQEDMMSDANLENMMAASYFGGMAAASTGLVHPLSAGLSIVLRVPHGRANCHVLSALGEFYPEESAELAAMLERNKIELPVGICRNLTDEQYENLYQGSIVHEKPLSNALGPDFKQILTRDKVVSLFKAM